MYRHIKKHDLDKYLLVIVGAFVFSFGVNLFTVPMGLFNGGVVGLSQIFRTIIIDKLHVPLPKNIDVSGIIYFLINIPAFIQAFVIQGRGFPRLLNISSNAGNTKTNMIIIATIASKTTIAG